MEFYNLITNQEISPAVIGLIEKAEKRVDIVSPYIKPWPHLESVLESAAKRDIIINVIFRSELQKDYAKLTKWLIDLGIHVFMVDRLHTKIYVSDKSCILTSMNLYNYSAESSEEFALTSPDEKLRDQVYKYLEELRSRAIPLDTTKVGRVFESVSKKEVDSDNRKTKPSTKSKPNLKKSGTKETTSKVRTPRVSSTGALGAFCIRCGEDLKFSMEKPLCYNCFKSWSKYKNPAFEEKHCHGCGKPHKSSLEKPLCMPCWKEKAAK